MARADYLMYTTLADRFHLVTAPADYAAEAAWVHQLIDRYATMPVRTLLELGSGGGNNASHLKQWYAMTLSDLSPAMLETSRRINPELPHHAGDMRTLRLEETFDAIFIHDAIVYLITADDVVAALRTARAHLRPGGVLIVQPDSITETHAAGTSWGGDDAPDGSGVRFLEWTHAAEPGATVYAVDFVYAVRDGAGRTTYHGEQHLCGVFSRDAWFNMLRQAGFKPDAVSDPPEVDSGRVTFIGVAI